MKSSHFKTWTVFSVDVEQITSHMVCFFFIFIWKRCLSHLISTFFLIYWRISHIFFIRSENFTLYIPLQCTNTITFTLVTNTFFSSRLRRHTIDYIKWANVYTIFFNCDKHGQIQIKSTKNTQFTLLHICNRRFSTYLAHFICFVDYFEFNCQLRVTLSHSHTLEHWMMF